MPHNSDELRGEVPTDDELATWLSQELSSAEGFESDGWAENIEDAINYYLARPRGDEQPGRSQVVSADVADMVEAVLANMVPSFAGDSVVQFDATSEDDETQAAIESDAVSQVIMEDNRGFVLFLESLKDALMLRNGIIKVFVQEREQSNVETFKNLDDMEILQVLEPRPDVVIELLAQEETDIEGEDGMDLRVRYTETERLLRVKSVPPENFKIEQNYDSIFLDEVNFCAERHHKSRSELLEMGFDPEIVRDLNRTSASSDTVSTTRNIDEQTKDETSQQLAQEEIEVFECYYRVDMTGDGITQRIKAWVSGSEASKLLSWEDVDFVPYGSGSPLVNPHRFLGYSVYDRVASVQDIKTAALRQWLDNAGSNNVNRATVVEGQVNMEDAKNNRTSGMIRQKAPGMYQPIPINDIGPSMMLLLDYQDRVRSERAGASLDLQSGEAQLIGSSVGSQGLDRIYSTKEQLAGLMTRTLAETMIRTTYLLVHQTMRSQMTGEINIRRGGQWTATDPSTWPPRNRVNIKIGLSPSERQRKSSNLQLIMQTQMTLLQNGGDGEITSLDKVHNAMIDWARSADVDAPEQYWIDPQSDAAVQAKQQKQAAAQQAQAAQEAKEREIVGLQVQLAQANLNVDQWKELIQTQFKYFDAVLSSEVEEAKLMKDSINGQLESMQLGGRTRSASSLGAESVTQ